jgi:ABC-type transporter Mla subunit MlaD
MKRVLAIACVLVAASALVVFGTGAEGDGGDYRVRAIFMNAFSVIPGEDVKIAGVKVGKVESLDVTPDHRAAVVLRIDRPGFDDFRRDAECSIRPQSLIGEKFVECTPTQPRPDGAQPPPPLRRIEEGEGKGQYLLPVSQTSKPVDLDLVNNTLRLPSRERLAIIVNELGTGLAGRGDDLRQAIRNADPALKETDKVLKILADQNRVLVDLARDGDRVLAPLSRDRAQVADFVSQANDVAQATAERSDDLEENIAKLPAFLRELKPTMDQLGGLAGQITPVLADLHDQAPSIDRFVEQLGPFSKAGTPALQTLGDTADVARPALVKSKPIIEQTGALAKAAKPVANNLADLTTSLRDTGGIEQLMDWIYYQVAAINGFDKDGHYLRAGLLLNQCSAYSITFAAACSAKFSPAENEEGEARAASAGKGGYVDDPRRSDSLRELSAYLQGEKLDLGASSADASSGSGAAHPSGSAASAPATGGSAAAGGSAPAGSAATSGSAAASGAAAPSGSAPTSSAATSGSAAASGAAAPSGSAPTGSAPTGSQAALLDYLLGGGG